MSTLKANTILAASGLAADPVAIPGLDKRFATAWVNFNGLGVVAIRSAYNVASITDNGVGDYTVNFTTPMANANYAPSFAGQRNVALGSPDSVVGINGAPTINGLRVICSNGIGGLEDFTIVSAHIMGGQA